MLLLLALPSLRRLSEVAIPSPIAVPSSSTFMLKVLEVLKQLCAVYRHGARP